ncbi:hypothetical protein ABZ389_34330, partial [Streptomyces sp. NPDC005877]
MTPAGPEYRWLLPSAVVAPELPGDRPGRNRPRRTVRDWIVDTCAFLCAAAIGMLAADAMSQASDYSETLQAADQLAGALACCALWLRRRWPVQLAWVLVVVTLVAPVAAGAVLVALFGVAVHRPLKPVVATVGAAALVTSWVQPVLRPDPSTGLLANAIMGTLMVLLAMGWGMLVRARRQLVVAHCLSVELEPSDGHNDTMLDPEQRIWGF